MKTRETTPGKTYSVHTTEGCTIIEPDGWQKTIEAPDGYFDAHFGSVVIEGDDKASIKALFKLAPQQKLALLGVLGGNADGLPAGYTPLEYLESDGNQYIDTEFAPTTAENFQAYLVLFLLSGRRFAQGASCAFCSNFFVTPAADGRRVSANVPVDLVVPSQTKIQIKLRPDEVSFLDLKLQISSLPGSTSVQIAANPRSVKLFAYSDGESYKDSWLKGYIYEFFATVADQKIHMIPALDESGAPCFYCVARKMTFYNKGAGAFIAGIETQKQLDAMLRKLPDRTGQDVGTLQVRLADELQTPENEAKMDAMRAKNWEISQAA